MRLRRVWYTTPLYTLFFIFILYKKPSGDQRTINLNNVFNETNITNGTKRSKGSKGSKVSYV
jgi:hypothetical protein